MHTSMNSFDIFNKLTAISQIGLYKKIMFNNLWIPTGIQICSILYIKQCMPSLTIPRYLCSTWRQSFPMCIYTGTYIQGNSFSLKVMKGSWQSSQYHTVSIGLKRDTLYITCFFYLFPDVTSTVGVPKSHPSPILIIINIKVFILNLQCIKFYYISESDRCLRMCYLFSH